MTITVETDAGRVTWAPPIARRFVGQPVSNLTGWLSRQGGLITHTYSAHTTDGEPSFAKALPHMNGACGINEAHSDEDHEVQKGLTK